MKWFKLIICNLLIFNCYAQGIIRGVTKSDSLKFEQIIKKQSDSLIVILQNETYLSESEKKIVVNFKLDTFRINSLSRRYITQDYSDYGMQRAILLEIQQYDILLNKYYKDLIIRLYKEDKEILKKAQRAWVNFRDLESELNNTISLDKYSGGGTIQKLIVLERELETIQNRVFELYQYLLRVNLKD